ncbi:MAG TPA: MFS transporter [Thermodesulfobacteriota bacterium]|nr:MFS transporter [Thermodesulfobacteriota bacterium]
MSARRTQFFYGYVVVGAAFIIMVLAWGSNRSFGVFVEPILRDFGWTRAALSGSFTLNAIVMGVLTLVAGRATDRFGPRAVLIVCGCFAGLSFILSSRIDAVWEFYVFYGVFGGIGMSGLLIPLMAAVLRWFTKYRGFMSGILVSGAGFGNMSGPLICTFLISFLGWRSTFLMLGIVTTGVICLSAVFVRRDPSELGLAPLGANEGISKLSGGITGMSFRQAFRTRPFWMINLISFCDLFLINVLVVHIVIHAIDMGIPATAAATVFSLAAGMSIVGRLIMGTVADRIGNRRALLVCLSASVSAFVILLFARSLPMLYVFSVCYGLGLWSTGAIMSPLVAELFGLKSHATIFSFAVFVSSIGSAAGPVLAGMLFDRTGSYQSAFFLCLGVSLVSVGSVLFLGKGKSRVENALP